MDDVISSAPSKLEEIKYKMHFTGKVIKTTLAGAIVDIGLEVPGVIHISQLQKDPVKRVEDVVSIDQEVDVWVKKVYPGKQRVELTMIKPLELEWREIDKEMVFTGKVTRLEKFGVFVDIGAERPGLVHISELTHDYVKAPGDVVKEGDEVEVKVLDVNRQKKQIKLSMKALVEKPERVVKALEQRAERKDSRASRERETYVEEVEKEEPVPTAMEMALRDAMEKARGTEDSEPKKKGKGEKGQNELEKILERTLKTKATK